MVPIPGTTFQERVGALGLVLDLAINEGRIHLPDHVVVHNRLIVMPEFRDRPLAPPASCLGRFSLLVRRVAQLLVANQS